MFIIKFNKMIRNKWVWGFFAGIVALAFVFGDFFSSSSKKDEVPSDSLDGEAVSQQEYFIVSQIVAFETRNTGASFDNTEREVWRRLAALKAADEIGLKVRDEELARIIHADPSFADQSGTFNPEIYNTVLRHLGITSTYYDQMVRRSVLIRRLEHIISSAAWISPASADEVARGYTDSFNLNTAIISNAYNIAEMEVSDEDVKAFYNKNQNLYSVPDTLQVVYTVFKAADFVEFVEVSEEEVLDYYDANERLFVVAGTNGVEQVRPLEDVRGEIESDLAMETAKIEAYRAAADFSDVFYTNRNESLTFEGAAAHFGYQVLTSRLFTATSSPVSVEGSPAFVEAAFALNPESAATRFSDAVDGGRESYVLGFYTNHLAHIKPFEDVENLAAAAARSEAAQVAFSSDIEKTMEGMVRGLEENKSFEDLVSELGLISHTNFVFTASDAFGENSFPGAQELAQMLRGMSSGELSKNPVQVPQGAMFFQVLERTSGDPMMYTSIKQQSTSGMYNDMVMLTWEEWLEDNLIKRNPVTRFPITVDSSSVFEDEYAE